MTCKCGLTYDYQDTHAFISSLTEREWMYLFLFALGFKDHEIADFMAVSSARVAELKRLVREKAEAVFDMRAVGLEAIR